MYDEFEPSTVSERFKGFAFSRGFIGARTWDEVARPDEVSGE